MAKACRVRQVIRAIEKLEAQGGWPLHVSDHVDPEDGEHPGRCAEFPSLSWLAPTPGEALSGIQEMVGGVLADMQANGESPPEPLADRTYSGRFVVRVPSETHRDLVIKATEEGVSLNRLESARLTG